VRKKTYEIKNTVKRVPIVINIENNYYYPRKQKTNALEDQISVLTAEIANIKSHLNI
jgi:ribosomal protein S15P/S13E